jgi:excisionase family DNA binding protein
MDNSPNPAEAIRLEQDSEDPGRLAEKPVPLSGHLARSPQAPRGGNGLQFVDRLACTIDEACSAIGLGRTKLYELIGEGRVETTSVGRRRLVLVRSLVALIDQRRDGVADGKVNSDAE